MRLRRIAAAVLAGLWLSPMAEAATAKNVIILISDGGGFNAYAAASYYQYGREGRQPYDKPGWVRYGARTASLSTTKADSFEHGGDSVPAYDPGSAWVVQRESDFAAALGGPVAFKGYKYLKTAPTDSAAAGTALASGKKARNGRINFQFDAETEEEYPAERGQTIAEVAKSLGKSVGIVTSVQWNDATPATFGGAHNTSRTNRREIANEMLASPTLDLIMGAGHPEFDANGAPRLPMAEKDYDIVGGPFTWELLQTGRHARGWRLVQSKGAFESLANRPPSGRVLGLAPVLGTLQAERQTRDWNRDGTVDSADSKVAPAYGDAFISTVPTLQTMTRGALAVLSRNPRGFFVMIEGGAVDKAGHANQPGRIIEEQIDFNRSVQAAVDWVNAHSNWNETLIIVTADHETGMLWGANSDTLAFDALMERGPGRMPGMFFNSGNHTNSLVPLRARGPGAEQFTQRILGADPLAGDYVDNTATFDVMKAALLGKELEPMPLASAGRSPTTRPKSKSGSSSKSASKKPAAESNDGDD